MSDDGLTRGDDGAEFGDFDEDDAFDAEDEADGYPVSD